MPRRVLRNAPFKTAFQTLFMGLLLVSLSFAKGHKPHPLIVKADAIEELLQKVEITTMIDPEQLRLDLKTRKFKSKDLESVRLKLRDLEAALMTASDGVQNKSDSRLKVITPVSVRYLKVLGRMVLLYARSAHLPNAKGGTILASDLSQYQFDDLDLGLRLGKKAGLALIAALAESRFPVKAKHVGAQIEFIVSEEQKQFAEFLTLSRSPNQWLSQKSGIEDGSSAMFSFDSKPAYGKFLQFSTVRETLINRWALNRMLPRAVSNQPVAACGKQILSFRPGKDGLMTSSAAFQELAAVDRYQAFSDLADEAAKKTFGLRLANDAAYGKILLETLKRTPGIEKPTTDYVAKNLESLGSIIAASELELWKDKASDIVRNSTLNGDELTAKGTAQRMAEQIFVYRTDAVKKALWDNLQGPFPSTERPTVDWVAQTQLEPLKKEYIAKVYAVLLPVLKGLDAAGMSDSARKERFNRKTEDLLFSIRASVQAVSELQTLIELGDEAKPTPANFRTVIEDPFTLKLFYEAHQSKLPLRYKRALEGDPKLKQEIVDFFEKIDKDFTDGLAKSATLPKDFLARVTNSHALVLQTRYPKPAGPEKKGIRELTVRDLEPPRVAQDNTRVVPRNPVVIPYENWEVVEELITVLGLKPKLWSKARNRDFTSTREKHRLLVSLLSAMAYNSSPALRVRWYEAPEVKLAKFQGVAGKHGFVRLEDGRVEHETKFWPKERSLLEHAAQLGYLHASDQLIEPKVRALIAKALTNAGVQAEGVLEKFCAADPSRYTDNAEFKTLFKAASAIRNQIKGSSPEIEKLDAEVAKEIRSWHERVLEDYIEPALKVVAVVGIVLFVLSGTGWIVGLFGLKALTAMMGAFYLSTAGALVTAGLLTATVTNLYFTINVNVIELPPQIGFQSRLANSQIGETEAVVDWDRHTAERSNMRLRQGLMIALAPLDVMFIKAGSNMVLSKLASSRLTTGLNVVPKGFGSKLKLPGAGSGGSKSGGLFTSPGAVGSTVSKVLQPVATRMQEVRKVLISVLGGKQNQIVTLVEPYMESAVQGLRQEIEAYRSFLKPQFWRDAIASPQSTALGSLPRSAQQAAKNGHLQAWYDDAFEELKPALQAHLSELEVALARMEGLHSKTRAVFGSRSSDPESVKVWAEGLTDAELISLRTLTAQEGVVANHLPWLLAEETSARMVLFEQLNQGFQRYKHQFSAAVKPSSRDAYDAYWGETMIESFEAGVVRQDVAAFSKWLQALRPSL